MWLVVIFERGVEVVEIVKLGCFDKPSGVLKLLEKIGWCHVYRSRWVFVDSFVVLFRWYWDEWNC